LSKKERKSFNFAQINTEILASFHNNKSVDFFKKKLEKFFKKVLTNQKHRAIINNVVARMRDMGA